MPVRPLSAVLLAATVTLAACTTGSDGTGRTDDSGQTSAVAAPPTTSATASAPANSAPSSVPIPTANDSTLPPETDVPSATAPDPCGLVTKADVGAELGPGASAGASDLIGVFQSCTYKTPDDAARYFDVTVQARKVEKDVFVESVLAEQKTTGIVPTKLDGPGEIAYDDAGTLSFWANGVQVTVLVTAPDGVDSMAVQKALGAKAVPRLGH